MGVKEAIIQYNDDPDTDGNHMVISWEPLVRCKDCKYGEKWNAVYACGKSRGFGTTHKPDWFCADGERAET